MIARHGLFYYKIQLNRQPIAYVQESVSFSTHKCSMYYTGDHFIGCSCNNKSVASHCSSFYWANLQTCPGPPFHLANWNFIAATSAFRQFHSVTLLRTWPSIHPRRPPTPSVFNSLVNARTNVHPTFMSNGYRVPFLLETNNDDHQLSSDPSWGWWRGQRRWWLVNLMLVMECDTEKIDSRHAFRVKHNGKPHIFVAVQVSQPVRRPFAYFLSPGTSSQSVEHELANPTVWSYRRIQLPGWRHPMSCSCSIHNVRNISLCSCSASATVPSHSKSSGSSSELFICVWLVTETTPFFCPVPYTDIRPVRVPPTTDHWQQ